MHILAKVNAIQDWRQLMGPTKVYHTIFTHPESIRGMFGLTDTRNATHGSGTYDLNRTTTDNVRNIRINPFPLDTVLCGHTTTMRDHPMFCASSESLLHT